MKHEDNRRILESYPEAKIITAKQDCVLGNHYHKVKTEKFVVLSGYVVLTIGNKKSEIMETGKVYTVNPNEKHVFDMEQGSVMIGLCSHTFDYNDDYKD